MIRGLRIVRGLFRRPLLRTPGHSSRCLGRVPSFPMTALTVRSILRLLSRACPASRISGRACQTSLRREPRQRGQGLYLANSYLKSVANGFENNLALTSTGYNSMLVARGSLSSWSHMVEQRNILCGSGDYLVCDYRYDHWLSQTWSVRKFLGICPRRAECGYRSARDLLRNSSGKSKLHLVFVAL